MAASTEPLQRLLQLYRQSHSPVSALRDAFRVMGTHARDAMIDDNGGQAARGTKAARGPIIGVPWWPLPGKAAWKNPAPPRGHTAAIRGEPAEQLELQETVVAMLRRLLSLRGDISSASDERLGCLCLGQLFRGARAYDVFFSGAGWDSSLNALLAHRSRASQPSIILIPTFQGVPFSAIHRYAPGAHVVLASLVSLLVVRGDGFCLQPTFDALTDVNGHAIGPGWWIITHKGRRSIARSEYDEILAERDRFDLFLDGAGTAFSHSYCAGYRDRRRKFHPVTLSVHQTHVLTELISSRVPLRPQDFRCLEATSIRSPSGIIDTARRAVDLRSSRYEWRSFHTIPGENSSDRRYVFRPPAGLRYACIVFGSSDPGHPEGTAPPRVRRKRRDSMTFTR